MKSSVAHGFLSMFLAGFLSIAKLLAKSPAEVLLEHIEDVAEGKYWKGCPYEVLTNLALVFVVFIFHFYVLAYIDKWCSLSREPWTPEFEGFKHDCRRNLVVIGNPGRGKSTLLNGIANEAKHRFESGFSLGTGLTFQKQDECVRGIHLIDSPGLADIKKRQEKAEEIESALKSEGMFKIVFVICLQGGRLEPDDIVTLRLVLKAVQQIDDNKYSIIINKACATTIEMFNLDKDKFIKDFQEQLFDKELDLPKTTKHIFPVAYVEKLASAKNDKLSHSRTLRDFLDQAPVIEIDKTMIQKINTEMFETLKAEYNKKIEELRLRLESQENAFSELKDRVTVVAARKAKNVWNWFKRSDTDSLAECLRVGAE